MIWWKNCIHVEKIGGTRACQYDDMRKDATLNIKFLHYFCHIHIYIAAYSLLMMFTLRFVKWGERENEWESEWKFICISYRSVQAITIKNRVRETSHLCGLKLLMHFRLDCALHSFFIPFAYKLLKIVINFFILLFSFIRK